MKLIMKSTGIIRRIDDLGRVVVPKEIRRTLNIREGDPLEIYVIDNMICYKKYVAEGDYINTISNIIENLSEDMDINNDTKNMLNTKLTEIVDLLNANKG